jgi:pilus assembly protein CpaD
VTRSIIRKDATMRSKFLLLTLGAALAGCTTPGRDVPTRGVSAVNVPVVTTADYVFDAAAPGGALAPGESDRLNGWFQGLGLGYGDTVYVDSAYSPTAHEQVARIAGQYGILMSDGAPITAGAVQPGAVRVVVSRRRAEVPGCPNWSVPSQPNFENRTMSNYGCGVNSNLAMQVANPEDLLHGREGNAAVDASTGAKAILMYRNWPLTGVVEGQMRRPFKPIEDTTTGGK